MSTTRCHDRCCACCVAPAISSPLPNMPQGKPAGVRCVNLDDVGRCRVYDQRPAVCREFSADSEVCGKNEAEALRLLGELETATR
ncbi:MAG: YkgJ family cysteine cluster protein [Oleiphilaceae bacterium]|nr:YkgJ family cysteine cluster protein [Oleiphilaceae bacterium]